MGHWAMMVSLSVATVDAGGKRLGPMSVPSGSRNLISNCSWTADISPGTGSAASNRMLRRAADTSYRQRGRKESRGRAATARGRVRSRSIRYRGQRGVPTESRRRAGGWRRGASESRPGSASSGRGADQEARGGGQRGRIIGAAASTGEGEAGLPGGRRWTGRGRGRQGEERRQWRGWELEVAGKGKE